MVKEVVKKMNSSLLPVFLLMICLVGLWWLRNWREKLIAETFSPFFAIWLLVGLIATPMSQADFQKLESKELKFLAFGQKTDDQKKTQEEKEKKQNDEEEDDDDNRKTGKKR